MTGSKVTKILLADRNISKVKKIMVQKNSIPILFGHVLQLKQRASTEKEYLRICYLMLPYSSAAGISDWDC